MGFLSDLFSILFQCIERLRSEDFALFRNTIIGGIFLGALCWVACSYFTRLWNLRFRVTLRHHVLCGLAAVLTLMFSLTYVSLKYTKQVAEKVIQDWQTQLPGDSKWGNKTFRITYEKVKALGVEDFTNYPHPDQGGTLVPLSKEKSRRLSAEIFANEAVKHFKSNHPYLSMILNAKSDISEEVIYQDVDQFFATHPNQLYPFSNAINLAALHIKKSLDEQVDKVVPFSRKLLIVLFFLAQAIPFGLVGFEAYRDLKVTV